MSDIVYHFGARTYTLQEIEDIGKRHGEDLIMYYPPQRWDDGVWSSNAQEAYDKGYKEGLKKSYKGDMSHLWKGN